MPELVAPLGSIFPENERTSFDALGMTDKDDVKILYYPRIAVLQENISKGEPITQAIIKEIYDMALSLLKHRHKYQDLPWAKTRSNRDPDLTNITYTDYPVQLNSMVDLGGPLMNGTVFEKWYMNPANNIHVLDASPMIYTRQFSLPSKGIQYYTNDQTMFPNAIPKSGFGLVLDFFIDTSDVIGIQQTFQTSVTQSNSLIINFDNQSFEVQKRGFSSLGEINFTPKNSRTHVVIKFINSNMVFSADYAGFYLRWDGKPIPIKKIFSLTPQSSLNTTPSDARITSVYALYQIILTLANHSHLYLDTYQGNGGNKSYGVRSSLTTTFDINQVRDEWVQYTASLTNISNVSLFSKPVVLN
jgi:hypothetical protein